MFRQSFDIIYSPIPRLDMSVNTKTIQLVINTYTAELLVSSICVILQTHLFYILFIAKYVV